MMKLAAILVAAFALSACGGDAGPNAPVKPPDTPPGPSPPPEPPPTSGSSASTFLWGMIVDGAVCIPGATILVVQGQRAGESIVQATPCDVWDYANGFEFEHLTAGVEMTLRASAPGYVELERKVIPFVGPQTAVIFPLVRQKHDGQ